jgi:Rps23 Pro-64 3,4-dihydroxylase Tpa1-like proline 4-hydroxylase
MKQSLSCKYLSVYDEVLTDEQFDKVFEYYNKLEFIHKFAHEQWNPVWSTTDGNVLSGRTLTLRPDLADPLEYPHDVLVPLLLNIGRAINNCGMFTPDELAQIESVAFTPFIYPPGCGLSWHTDNDYVGAFSYYIHKRWSPDWSGEFLSVETDDHVNRQHLNGKWLVFDQTELHNTIMDRGHGRFVFPKTNRLVINKAGKQGTLHKVNKSTPQAENRLSLQGFLRRKNNG